MKRKLLCSLLLSAALTIGVVPNIFSPDYVSARIASSDIEVNSDEATVVKFDSKTNSSIYSFDGVDNSVAVVSLTPVPSETNTGSAITGGFEFSIITEDRTLISSGRIESKGYTSVKIPLHSDEHYYIQISRFAKLGQYPDNYDLTLAVNIDEDSLYTTGNNVSKELADTLSLGETNVGITSDSDTYFQGLNWWKIKSDVDSVVRFTFESKADNFDVDIFRGSQKLLNVDTDIVDLELKAGKWYYFKINSDDSSLNYSITTQE